jgi:hypothetical protein
MEVKCIAAFEAWMERESIEAPLGELANFQGLRGVRAREKISTGDMIVSYPRSATMDLTLATKCPCSELVDSKCWDSIPDGEWFVKLALWLVSEKHKGEGSRWKEYISLLPTTTTTPFHWTDTQLELLSYPPAVSSVREQRALFGEIWERVSAASQSTLQKDELFWGMEMALSRAFDSSTPPPANLDLLGRLMGRGTAPEAGILKALVPMGDSLNHLSDVKPILTFEPGNDRFTISADRAYSVGEQVFTSYGDKDNDSLLALYGFVEVGNPHDRFRLSGLGLFLAAQPGGEARLEELAARRVVQAAIEGELLRGGLPSPATLAALRCFVATAEELPPEGAEGRVALEQPLSFGNELRAVELMREHVVATRVGMAGSARGDRELLRGGKSKKRGKVGAGESTPQGPVPLGTNERIAITFRIEKRKILLEAEETLKGYIEKSNRSGALASWPAIA